LATPGAGGELQQRETILDDLDRSWTHLADGLM
jgi:hypothetical protein